MTGSYYRQQRSSLADFESLKYWGENEVGAWTSNFARLNLLFISGHCQLTAYPEDSKSGQNRYKIIDGALKIAHLVL